MDANRIIAVLLVDVGAFLVGLAAARLLWSRRRG
jgi:hypothetical protein